MNKNDLIASVADRTGMAKAGAGQAVDATFDAITAALGELKAELDHEDATSESIREKMEATITASQALAQRLYAQAAQEQQADAPSDDDEDIVEGIDALPGAFLGMLAGDNVGKRLVRLG